MILSGKVLKYGDNVDTDVIIPARYMNSSDKRELVKHAMEDIDADYLNKVESGDIMVAGVNFGCGSSREHAPLVIKESGISIIIAKSFARIFYRNAINIGLPILEHEQAAEEINDGDKLTVELKQGKLINVTQGKEYAFAPPESFLEEIMKAGGLVAMAKKGKLR